MRWKFFLTPKIYKSFQYGVLFLYIFTQTMCVESHAIKLQRLGYFIHCLLLLDEMFLPTAHFCLYKFILYLLNPS